MHKLLVLVHALLAIEHLIANVTKHLVVLAFVPQQMLVQGFPVLELFRANVAGNPRRLHFQVGHLMGHKGFAGLERFSAHFTDERIGWPLVDSFDVRVQSAFLPEDFLTDGTLNALGAVYPLVGGQAVLSGEPD